MKNAGRVLVLLVLFSAANSPTSGADSDNLLKRIAFGSCANQDREQPIWDKIIDTKPDLFLFIGDNIYADTEKMDEMRDKYKKLGEKEGYQKLLKTCPLMATWDDHDYGKNDAGAEFPQKVASQKEFLTFFKEPADSPRWKQEGIYEAKIFGPVGKRVQVIMLDTRYFRSPFKGGGKGGKPYVPNIDADATVLGETQWKWLEEQLKKPAELRIIATSIQLVAEEHPYEKWANFPKERERFFKLVQTTKAEGVVLVSGDRHLAELSMEPTAASYPVYDLTSSGLNQGFKSWRQLEKNSYRVSTMPFGDNFGLITIDWAEDPRLSLQIRDGDGEITIQQRLKLSTLKMGTTTVVAPKVPLPEGVLAPDDAAKKVGEKVTVQFVVQSSGGKSNRYLNSLKDFRDEKNFAIMIPAKIAEGFKDVSFEGKTIRVMGTVSKNKDNATQIVVEDAKMIQIVENEPKKQ